MNITLIGLPGSGKSFIGEKLAESLGFKFVDPDKLLENQYGQPLQQVLEKLGEVRFLQAEADLSAQSLAHTDNVVLATGGSIVYSSEAMKLLSDLSTVVYLRVDKDIIKRRIGDTPRGIIGLKDRSFDDVCNERMPLYEKWASVIIDGSQESSLIISQIAVALRIHRR